MGNKKAKETVVYKRENTKLYYIRIMRVRTKDCYKCYEPKEVLYRCRFQELKDWIFLCGNCLQGVKEKYEDTYQYGGTWKSKKK